MILNFQSLFASSTIAPSYKVPHILYTLILLYRSPTGIGRYRIKNEVGLGEGSTKTLLNRLKDEGIIMVDKHKQKGHVLTAQGKKFIGELERIMSLPLPLDNDASSFVVGEFAHYSILHKGFLLDSPKLGIKQRDEAIKIGGEGATCLTFDGKEFRFSDGVGIDLPIPSVNLSTGDIVVIGGGHSIGNSIVATIAAGITLLKEFTKK